MDDGKVKPDDLTQQEHRQLVSQRPDIYYPGLAITEAERKLIEEGKATVLGGRVVQSSEAAMEGRK